MFHRFLFQQEGHLFLSCFLKFGLLRKSAASSKHDGDASACAFAERPDRVGRLDGGGLRLRVAAKRGTGAGSGHCIPEQK